MDELKNFFKLNILPKNNNHFNQDPFFDLFSYELNFYGPDERTILGVTQHFIDNNYTLTFAKSDCIIAYLIICFDFEICTFDEEILNITPSIENFKHFENSLKQENLIIFENLNEDQISSVKASLIYATDSKNTKDRSIGLALKTWETAEIT